MTDLSVNSVSQPDSRLVRWLGGQRREPVITGGFAIVVGVIGGLGAIVFRLLIKLFYYVFHFSAVADSPLRAIIPAVGLVLVGLITHYFASEVKGHGVPQILESLALRGGKIRPRVAFFGILAPAITIGSGGSVGREGPIALIGGSFGSIIGQWLKLPDKYTSLFLACGSAAGIAATFNAPIAGGFFGLEVVLGTYAMGAIFPVFLAAVTGTTVFDLIMGNHPVLATAPYPVIHPEALLFMIVLGAIAGVVGIGYSKGLTLAEDWIGGWQVPFWVRNATGGLVVGAIGLLAPGVLGVGYPSIHEALSGELALGTLALLLVFKYVATLTTVGSGGSGGVFAPSLFLGSMLGAVYGDGLRRIVPGLIPHPEIYAIAGMGAIFAAAAQAPFVAITILLEVTGDYQLTPVVIAACVTAYIVHGILTRDSMYTVKLARRGIRILRGNEVRPTQRIAVKAAMTEPRLRLTTLDTARGAYEALMAARDHAAVVVQPDGTLLGVITMNDLRERFVQNSAHVLLQEIVPSGGARLIATQSLEDAMRMFAFHDASLLPVTEQDGKTLVGVLTQGDVLRAYNSFTLSSTEANAKVQQLQELYGEGGQFTTVRLDAESALADRTLSQVRLPAQAVVVSVMREGETLVAHGGTTLRVGDEILVFVSPASMVDEVLAKFREAPE